MWDFVSFSRSDPFVWILFQISLRLVVSFGVALLFFYLITKPPSPIVSLKVTSLSFSLFLSHTQHSWFS
ncbi:hypothetical protein HanOQP8_Chr01g0021171 [Helianthus annuus]|nr:hypothetical protein HanOQP8_Chr01g0021171 [Helianthus annuus]